MDGILARSLKLLVCVIFFPSLSLAVCPGSSHETDIAGYALSRDSTRIAALAHDGTLFWWDVASGKRVQLVDCVKRSEPFDSPILFSPDSARIAIAAGNEVHIFDLAGNLVARLASAKQKTILTIIFSGNGRRIAASDFDGATVWDIAGQAELFSIAQKIDGRALALNQDGTLLATNGPESIELWDTRTGSIAKRFRIAEGWAERFLFTPENGWLVAQTAQTLPLESPRQHTYKYRREIGVWNIASGEKIRSFSGPAEEIRFSLTLIRSHTLAATDYTDHLYFWNLETGVLESIWDSPMGHPSTGGELLLHEGGEPGQLQLWKIGGSHEKARSFAYRSAVCAQDLVAGSASGKPKFELLFYADGSVDEEEFGSFSSIGYVAADCSRLHYSRSAYKSPQRAEQELEQRIAMAEKIIARGTKPPGWEHWLPSRTVACLSRKYSWPCMNVVMWVDGNALYEISSVSLPAVLALEAHFLEKDGR